jgi:hypothetical protein
LAFGGFSAALAAWMAPSPARAIDEIQVYNADIVGIGQWALEQHLNYVAVGRTLSDFPGGLISNHSLNGTPELAYGVADWWELGAYAPFSFDQAGTGFSDGGKLRTLFVTPHAEQRDFFYGVNFEFSVSTPRFSQTRMGLEMRPILGYRQNDFEFIVNPIMDFALAKNGAANFAPAVRLARYVDRDLAFGVEYYGALGQIGPFLPAAQQQHSLFAVTDFKLGEFDVHLGVGHGLTPGSDRLVFTGILGYAFPVAGAQHSPSLPLGSP